MASSERYDAVGPIRNFCKSPPRNPALLNLVPISKLGWRPQRSTEQFRVVLV
jgi:hypothetical protein